MNAKNCIGTGKCSHKKLMGNIVCSVSGCAKLGTDRSHVHINGNKMISLVMFCTFHNRGKGLVEYKLKRRAAIVPLPDCNCCKCGCMVKYYNNESICIIL